MAENYNVMSGQAEFEQNYPVLYNRLRTHNAPLSGAERSRRFREKRKNQKSISLSKTQIISNQDMKSTEVFVHSSSSIRSHTIVNEVDENVCNSCVSTDVQDKNNLLNMQDEVYKQNSSAFHIHGTVKKAPLTGAERVRLYRERRKNKNCTSASCRQIVPNEDIKSSAVFTYPGSSVVLNTTANETDKNGSDSPVSTEIQNKNNLMNMQGEMYKQNYSLLHNYHRTVKKAALTGTERVRLFRERRKNQKSKPSSCAQNVPKGDNSIQGELVMCQKYLGVLPKREILYSVEHLQSKRDIPITSDQNAKNNNIRFPLVFTSLGSVALPRSTVPLLYILKCGIDSELVSDLVKPHICSISIDSDSPVVDKGELDQPSLEVQNLTDSESNEILGIPMPVDESQISVEPSKEVLDIPLKLEPLDDGYENVSNKISVEKVEDTALPIISKAFSCECAHKKETDIKQNTSFVKAGNSFFPLVFTLKGPVCDTTNGKILVYDLKQGSSQVQITETAAPELYSVQIYSMHEAAFQFKDSMMLKTEVPLSMSIQIQDLEDNSNIAFSNYSVNAAWPVTGPRDVTVHNSSTQPQKHILKTVETRQVPVTEVLKDDDYQFVMSILQDLKRISPDEKNIVKRRIKDLFVTT